MEVKSENLGAKAKRHQRNHPKRKGTRKWHHRGFDGCSTCRKRHAKCDERQPNCFKCEVLSLECGGYARPLVFKVFGAPTEEITAAEQGTVDDMHEHNGSAVQQVTGRTIKHHNTSHGQNTMSSPIPNLLCLDSRYYSHFLGTVSTILIVFDTPYNSNPYRLSFPQLAESSWSLTESMKALGALRLANTTAGQDSKRHLRYAVSIYGKIMNKLRSDSITPSQPRLSDLATNLLLCVFEVS
jgi:Fungal Zn(2)-Cys(6) binuclear cluster domain/Fungal specific transcription factor domain